MPTESRWSTSLDVEKRVLRPNQPQIALTIYSLARIKALVGQKDEAQSLLQDAVDHGLRPRVDLKLEGEPDFNSLQGDPRFAGLVVHAKQVAARQTAQ